MEHYMIGIDSGTSGIKAVLFDLAGNELYKKGFPLTAICPVENQYEEDMAEIWEKAVLCVQEVARHASTDSIAGIGITAQGDGLWMIDRKGEPVRNGCCFCDGRAGEIVEGWLQDGTVDKVFALTGTRLFSGNQNGIVKWMEQNEKESLDQAAWLLHLKDYLFYKLTGKITTDASDQSLALIDPVTGQYSRKAFELCGIEAYMDKYPPLCSPQENAAHLLPQVAQALGLSPDVVVTSGPMDVAACALGSGVIEAGHCCSIIGTAALHEMVTDKPLADTIVAGMTVTHGVEDRWLRLMASLAGTPNLEWALNTFGGQIRREAEDKSVNVFSLVEDMVREVPIGANGVLYHPYLLAGGERAPFTESRARASYTGISVRHTLADILRATYEGVALAMLDCYSHMPQKPTRVTVCGGGAKSSFWCQMFADVLGTEIVTIEGEELGVKGVVIHNAVVQGFYPSYQAAVKNTVREAVHYQPNLENHEKYARLYPLYQATCKQLMITWKLRASLLNED